MPPDAHTETAGAASPFYQYATLFGELQYALPRRKTLAWLARDAPAHPEALDWGCGNGHWSWFLTGLGIRTTGFAFEDSLAACLSEREFRFVAGNASEPTQLPFEDARFDAVFSIGVLEHVHETGGDQLASLMEIRRILKPGGHFFCFHLPNRFGVSEVLVRALRPWKEFAGHKPHSRTFRPKDIRSLTAHSGLHLEEQGAYNLLPRNMAAEKGVLAQSRRGTLALDTADRVLARLLPVVCNQLYFIACRP